MDRVEKEVFLRARPERVWQYLVDPELLAGWLMRNDFTAEPGARFRFRSSPREGWDGVVECRVIELVEPKRLVYSWQTDDVPTETVVEIELIPEGEGTRLRLAHRGFDREEDRMRHEGGWDDHLDVLTRQIDEEAQGGQISTGPIDWSEFRLHNAISVDPGLVLQSWRTVRGLESFFVEMMRITTPDGREREPDEAALPGDRYVLRWHNGRTLRGEFLEPEHDDEIRFTFGESKVSVRAVPWDGGTLQQLRQFEIPVDEKSRLHVHANCRGGWAYFMTLLKGLLETGVSFRDDSRATGSSFSTYFDPSRLGLDL